MTGPRLETITPQILEMELSWNNHCSHVGHTSPNHLGKQSQHGSSNCDILSSDIRTIVLRGFLLLREVCQATEATSKG